MIRTTSVIAGASLAFLAAACGAQEEDAPELYTYATYFSCPGGPLERADEIMAGSVERMDGLVEDGTITAWGWLAHHTGGHWSRIAYHQAASLDGLLDALEAIQGNGDDAEEEAEAAAGDDGPGLIAICNSHEDYIWQVESGTVGKERGAAGFSVYHVCDMNREDRADEIVESHFAPIFNKLVEDGKLTSWSWQSHVVGGEFRKLQTMSAEDHKSLIAARGEAIEMAYADDNAAGEEFTEICGQHVDYMWDIVHETP